MVEPTKITRIGARLAEARSVKPRGNGGLPEDCPVYALGQSGTHFWFLNTLQQIVAVPLGRMSGAVMQGLFSGQAEFLETHWPKSNKHGDVIGFDNMEASNALMAACQRMGMYDGTQLIIRGRGAHPGEDGDLVFNLGYALWVRNQIERVGARDDGFIYPRGNSLSPPTPVRQPEGPDGPAAMIEDVLRGWNWPETVYPRLLLGWLALSTICGALEWRPHVWITAPHKSGKSTLLNFLGAILGDLALKAEDATAASLRASMGHDTLPMILDETELKVDGKRLEGLVELVRLSASGGLALRATSDQEVRSFTLRSTLLFASINAPPLKSQDQSRFCFLKMLRHNGGAEPMFRKQTLGTLGKQLFRRMLDRAHDLPAALETWREHLTAAGVEAGRDAKQYGMLLACAELVMWDSPRDAEEQARWAGMVARVTMEARTEQMEEWQRVLQTLVSSMSNAWKGGDHLPLSALIATAAQRECVQITDGDRAGEWRMATIQESDQANLRLGSLGLRVVFMKDGEKRRLRKWRDDETKAPSHLGDGDYLGWLALANSNASLNAAVFRHTHWAARSGTSGAWNAVLIEAPGAIREILKIAGATARCVLVPLDRVLDGEREEGE